MKVREEIDALKTMGLDPVRFLVVTRVVAAVCMTPLLTIFADLLGLIGGAVVMLSLGFPLITYFHQVQYAVSYGSLVGGLVKAFVFGILVAGIGCLRGLQTDHRRQRGGRVDDPRRGERHYLDRDHRRYFFGGLLLSESLNGPSMTEREAIIRVENFTAAYDGQVVLDNLNFEVYAGEVFAILGGSGSGKSTLLKHMIGLVSSRQAGTILIDGEDIAAAAGAARLQDSEKVRRHVSKRRACSVP